LKPFALTGPFIFDVTVDYEDKHNGTLPQFIPYKDGVYSVIQKKVTWYEALNACSQSGGELASVHNPNGKLFLEDIVNRDGFPLWVGLSSHDVSPICFQKFPKAVALKIGDFWHKVLTRNIIVG
jgi:hypothetical protein